jgi:hypothetical protein
VIVTFSIYGALQVTHVGVLLFIDERVREINRNILYEEFHTGFALQSTDNPPATTTADFIFKRAPLQTSNSFGALTKQGAVAALDDVRGKRVYCKFASHALQKTEKV